MPKTATITTRVDDKLKAQAVKVLRKVGVTPTEVITMLLHQIVLRQGVPFDIDIPNAETQRAMRELDAGKGEVFRGSSEELFDRITKPRK